ncbi:hypothetical protein POTOM_024656 [Populus tomentosa]|uniref:3'-5' exonuclease domain-containing protein n=1 Tax=Populus tomentosa TaxID=118781 RepID=A0A8X8CN07_POPTO|nr:hypothetical protein POTOM_024656 [Populus tomentosa]
MLMEEAQYTAISGSISYSKRKAIGLANRLPDFRLLDRLKSPRQPSTIVSSSADSTPSSSSSTTTMAISIEDHQLPYNTHNLYDVNFFDDKIHTLVTHTPSFVNTWIAETQQKLHQNNNPADHPLLVGLDIEWRPNRTRQMENPVATLQLSTGKDCLIFQLLHCPTGIPQSLYDFLSNKNYTFVGVGIEGDVEKLVEDYDVSMGNAVDLRVLAAEKLGAVQWKNSGLKSLVKEILGKQIEKPKRVTMSRWDNEWLTGDQVQYACLDAFLCYKIGENLYAA